MRVDKGDEMHFICEWCTEEIVGAPIMLEGYATVHFCTSYCALKWTCKTTLATVNGRRTMP